MYIPANERRVVVNDVNMCRRLHDFLLSDIAQGLEFIQSRSGQAQPSYVGYQDATSLLPVSGQSKTAD